MLLYIILALIFIWTFIAINEQVTKAVNNRKRKIKYNIGLFVNNFIDSKVLFVNRFGMVPSLGVITEIDSTRAYQLIRDEMGDAITNVHQLNVYDFNTDSAGFQLTILELTSNRIIEIGVNYVEILYAGQDYDWAKLLLKRLATCRTAPAITEEKAPTIVGFARNAAMN